MNRAPASIRAETRPPKGIAQRDFEIAECLVISAGEINAVLMMPPTG
jgi:hypothetical protein